MHSQHGSKGIRPVPLLEGLTVLLGRAFFGFIFLMAGPLHFTHQEIAYAASVGLPLASFLVPLSGIIALMGALSIILGFHAKFGAWMIVIFLIPVTLMMHKFWSIADPMAAKMQMIMFMKNLSMLGASLLITHFGAGPLSLDARRSK